MTMIRDAGHAMAALGLSALLLAGPATAEDRVDLNGFLGSFADDCEGDGFVQYMADISETLPRTGVLPEFPLPRSGDTRMRASADYVHHIIPVEGTYSGLRVSELSFAVGRKVGMYALFVTFDETEARVLDVVGGGT